MKKPSRIARCQHGRLAGVEPQFGHPAAESPRGTGDHDSSGAGGWRPGLSGAPRLDDAVAWIDCRIDRVVAIGDHRLVLGRVLDLDIPDRYRSPLVFRWGGYGRVVVGP